VDLAEKLKRFNKMTPFVGKKSTHRPFSRLTQESAAIKHRKASLSSAASCHIGSSLLRSMT
jgi:hypothetical protein